MRTLLFAQLMVCLANRLHSQAIEPAWWRGPALHCTACGAQDTPELGVLALTSVPCFRMGSGLQPLLTALTSRPHHLGDLRWDGKGTTVLSATIGTGGALILLNHLVDQLLVALDPGPALVLDNFS